MFREGAAKSAARTLLSRSVLACSSSALKRRRASSALSTGQLPSTGRTKQHLSFAITASSRLTNSSFLDGISVYQAEAPLTAHAAPASTGAAATRQRLRRLPCRSYQRPTSASCGGHAGPEEGWRARGISLGTVSLNNSLHPRLFALLQSQLHLAQLLCIRRLDAASISPPYPASSLPHSSLSR